MKFNFSTKASFLPFGFDSFLLPFLKNTAGPSLFLGWSAGCSHILEWGKKNLNFFVSIICALKNRIVAFKFINQSYLQISNY